jgi:hypothetical protein
MRVKNVFDKEVNIRNHDKLKARYDSEEFNHIRSTLWIQSGYVIYRLEVQEEQIYRLKQVLNEELINYPSHPSRSRLRY